MADLIERQAALDAISAWRRDYPLDLQEPIDDCWNSVRELPAVQPDHNADISKKVSISCAHENDVVSRKAAIEAIAKQMPRSYTPDGSHPADEEIYKAQEIYVDCIESIEILPAVQPEIIRCKDCDWWTKQKDSLQGRCELMQMYPTGGWYCGNARRRGGDSD